MPVPERSLFLSRALSLSRSLALCSSSVSPLCVCVHNIKPAAGQIAWDRKCARRFGHLILGPFARRRVGIYSPVNRSNRVGNSARQTGLAREEIGRFLHMQLFRLWRLEYNAASQLACTIRQLLRMIYNHDVILNWSSKASCTCSTSTSVYRTKFI